MIFPPLSDKFGRKIFVIGVCVLQLLSMGVLLIIKDQFLFFLMTAFIGASAPLKAMIAYTHLMEWIHGYESLISGLLFFYDGLMFIFCPLILVYVTKNTTIFVYSAVAINVIALAIFLVKYFPESPVFLLDKDRFKEFDVILQKLFIENKVGEQ